MKAIILIIFCLFVKNSFGLDTETFNQKFKNYFELGYRQLEGASAFDDRGTLSVSNYRDTNLFQDPNQSVPTEIQQIFSRNSFFLDFKYQYFITPNFNVNGNLSFKNDNVETRDFWVEYIDTLGGIILEPERNYPDKSQSLFMPIDFNLEYFFTKEKFISSVFAGTSIAFGETNPFIDSTLNGNGVAGFNFGGLFGYRNKVAYFELRGNYLTNSSVFEDLLNVSLAIDVTKVENVDLFVKVNYYQNLTPLVKDSFNSDLPNTNFRLVNLLGGITIDYNQFKLKVFLNQTLDGANIIDYRGLGISLSYLLGSKPSEK
ncbi:hypothetical protein OAQ99_04585 [Candidatus Kapabacteria bacterium]|nr:hypothetical protein [Candidatus Kapabacteria bacterium]